MLWDGGVARNFASDLPPLFPGATGSIESGALNNLGHVVGVTYNATEAFLWADGSAQALGIQLGLGGVGVEDLTDDGAVVGWMFGGYVPLFMGYLWQDGTTVLLPSSAGLFGAVAMNSAGWVVGAAWDEVGYGPYVTLWIPLEQAESVPEPTVLTVLALAVVGTPAGRKRPRISAGTGGSAIAGLT